MVVFGKRASVGSSELTPVGTPVLVKPFLFGAMMATHQDAAGHTIHIPANSLYKVTSMQTAHFGKQAWDLQQPV